MQQHATFVWDKYVKDSGFDQISVVAHSAGGGCVAAIQQMFEDTFYSQVVRIAYTDSWVISKNQLNQEQQAFMYKHAIHFSASDKPVATLLSADPSRDTCREVSAGHVKHEYTTGTSFSKIIEFFGYKAQ